MATKQDIFEAAEFAAQKFGVDENVLVGMLYQESRWGANARTSSAGAKGVAQFMPGTAKEYGLDPENPDPIKSVIAMGAMLRDNLDQHGGDYRKAIAGYNWGPNREAFKRDNWFDSAPEETRNYVDIVTAFADRAGSKIGRGTAAQRPPAAKALAPTGAGGGRGSINPDMADPSAPPGQGGDPGWDRAIHEGERNRAQQIARDRTWGERVKDAGVQLAQGGNKFLQLPVALVAPGSEVHQTLKEQEKQLASMESETMQLRHKALQQKVGAQDGEWGKFKTSLAGLIDDPSLASAEVIKQIPNMALALATGGLGALAGRAGASALGAGAASATNAARIGMGVGQAAGGAIGASGDAAGSVYDKIMDRGATPVELLERNEDFVKTRDAALAGGKSAADAEKAGRHEVAVSKSRMAAAIAAPVGAVSGVVGLKADGGLIARKAGQSAVAAGARAVVAEEAGELGEELATQLAGNVAVQTVNPNQKLTEGFGETAAQTLVGTAPHAAAAGAQHARAQAAPAPAQPGAQVFTEPGSPSDQAGLTPIVVPEPVAPQAAATPAGAERVVESPTAAAAREQIAHAVAGGDVAPEAAQKSLAALDELAAAPGPKVGKFGDVAAPVAESTPIDAAAAADAPAERVVAKTWMGRRGDGYKTEGDARMAIEARRKNDGHLDWVVEPSEGGRFKLSGYERTQQDGGVHDDAGVGAGLAGPQGEAAGAVGSDRVLADPGGRDATAGVVAVGGRGADAVATPRAAGTAVADGGLNGQQGTAGAVAGQHDLDLRGQPGADGASGPQASQAAAPARGAAAPLATAQEVAADFEVIATQRAAIGRRAALSRVPAEVIKGGHELERLASSLGTKLVFYKDAGDGGFGGARLGDRIYVDARRPTSAMAGLVMHEAGHALDGDIKQEMIDALAPHLDGHESFDQAFPQYRKRGGDELVREEMSMRAVQDLFESEEAHARLAERVGQEKYGRIVRALIGAVRKLLGRSAASSEWVKNFDEALDVMTRAFAKQMDRFAERQQADARRADTIDADVRQLAAATPQAGHADTPAAEPQFSNHRRPLVSGARELERAIDSATRELERWLASDRRGGIDLGRTPHVLHMVEPSLQAQSLRIDGAVLDKVFRGKHAGEMDGVTPAEFVRSIYRPAMVFRSSQSEYEFVTNIVTPDGPVMVAVKAGVTVRGGARTAVVMSAYPRAAAGPGGSLNGWVNEWIRDPNHTPRKLRYVDVDLAKLALTGAKNDEAHREGGLLPVSATTAATRDINGPSRANPASPGASLGATRVNDSSHSSSQPLRDPSIDAQIVPYTGRPVNQNYIGWASIEKRITPNAKNGLKDRDSLLQWIDKRYQGDEADKPQFSEDQTETPEFKRWFGDSQATQAVNADPSQIKSAIGNRGTFDPGDARIAFSEDGSTFTHDPTQYDEGADIGESLANWIDQDFDRAAAAYARIKESDGGRVLNTDIARELSPSYRADRSRSADVHEAASAFIKRLYAQRLDELRAAAEPVRVMFTAGGTGAGKSSGMRALDDGITSAPIVYDTNMNKLGSSVEKIRQALDAGGEVDIAFTYRDPVEALEFGALPRAQRMGRTVPMVEHMKTHTGALEVSRLLEQKYRDNPRVRFHFVDNSRGAGGAVAVSSLDNISVVNYDSGELKEKLHEALERSLAEGRISTAVYRGFAGQRTEDAPVGEHDVREAQDRARAGRPGEGGRGDADVLRQQGQPERLRAGAEGVALSEDAARAALDAIAENDELFALPKPTTDTVAKVAAEIDPQIKVSPPKHQGLRQVYQIKMQDGKLASLTVRKPNPYGPDVYAYDLRDGEMVNQVTERPGENSDEVDPATEDVFIDVSSLDEGGSDARVYAIAAGFAHNTGRIFIGDPAGLSDAALRRRNEQMLSSALKYGTTRHLAPHPRQVAGDTRLGVSPLEWVYGDDAGNIERMMDVSVKALERGYPDAKELEFDADTGRFLERSTARPHDLRSAAAVGERAREDGSSSGALAGSRTLKRGAVLRALLREARREGAAGGRRDGVLARLARVGSDAPEATAGIFHSDDPDHAFDLNSIRPARQKPASKAKDSWLIGKDEAGYSTFGAGKKAYDAIARVLDPLWRKLQMKPMPVEMKRAMREMQNELRKANERTAKVAEAMADLSKEDREMVSDVIEGELKAGVTPPKYILDLAANISKLMSKQTQELIEAGMLTTEAAERWKDKYLPRFYDQSAKQTAQNYWDAAKRVFNKPSGMEGIKGNSLKRRGMYRTIPASRLAAYEAEGWAIADRHYRPGIDEQVQVHRDYSRAERERMGEIRDSMFRFVMGYTRAQKDLAIARLYEHLAATEASRNPIDGWVQVPDTKVDSTEVKKYGKLAGLYVSPEIHSHLTAMAEPTSDFLKAYRRALGYWKEGKALALDTPIPTPTGWSTMGALNVGDEVFDEGGNICRVTFATPVQHDRECFEVELSDGDIIVADAEHLWFTIRDHQKPDVRTTADILATLKERTRGDNRHSIPLAGALRTPDVALPVPPYAIGAWLGDGCSRTARIVSGAIDHDELVAHLVASGVECGDANIDKRNGVRTFSITASGCPRSELAQAVMRRAGIIGNKHIPSAYLRASEAQRMELLRGLMDTDGTIDRNGKCSFTTTLPGLRDGVMELLRSLGYKPAFGVKKTAGADAYTIRFHATAERPVFHLARNMARLLPARGGNTRSTTRQIVAVRPVQSVPVRCIQVSSESRLYLAGRGMVPTHNTVLNPVSHVNNVVSNVTMAHFAGVSYTDVHKYAGAISDFFKKDGMIDEAREAGLFGGTVTQAELVSMLPKEAQVLAQQIGKAGAGNRGVMDIVMQVLSMGLRKPLNAAYEAEDLMFRYVIYRDARKRGMRPNDAVDYAQRFVFTYDDLPRGAQWVRDTGLPFFSWTYKAAPVLLQTAMTHPIRFAAPAAVIMGANMLAYAIAFGGDDDDDALEAIRKGLLTDDGRARIKAEEERERTALPKWMRGRSALGTQKAIRLGTDERTAQPVFLDISRWLPGGDMLDMENNAGGVDWIPQPLTPSTPLLSIYLTFMANKDMFRGGDFFKRTDTTGEKFGKGADWLWRQVAPAIAPFGYVWDRTAQGAADMKGDTIEVPVINKDYTGVGGDGLPTQMKYSMLQNVGVKARPIDLDNSEQIDAGRRKADIRELEGEIRRVRKQVARGSLSERQGEKQIDLHREKIGRLREGLTVDGEERD